MTKTSDLVRRRLVTLSNHPNPYSPAHSYGAMRPIFRLGNGSMGVTCCANSSRWMSRLAVLANHRSRLARRWLWRAISPFTARRSAKARCASGCIILKIPTRKPNAAFTQRPSASKYLPKTLETGFLLIPVATRRWFWPKRQNLARASFGPLPIASSLKFCGGASTCWL